MMELTLEEMDTMYEEFSAIIADEALEFEEAEARFWEVGQRYGLTEDEIVEEWNSYQD